MKKMILSILLLASVPIFAQKPVQFYFIEIRPTGKMEVELKAETGVTYPDIDSLLIGSSTTTKKGAVITTGKKYDSYTAAFNALSGAGLQFVQFANLSTMGGASALLTSDVKTIFTIWKKD